jgi:hypothetical protein
VLGSGVRVRSSVSPPSDPFDMWTRLSVIVVSIAPDAVLAVGEAVVVVAVVAGAVGLLDADALRPS